MKEGREVVVKGVYWFAHETEVEELLATYGTVESVRIPKTHEGKSKGTAFVVFEDKVCNYTSPYSLLQLPSNKTMNYVNMYPHSNPPILQSANLIIPSSSSALSPSN
jgi:hypothetical protein